MYPGRVAKPVEGKLITLSEAPVGPPPPEAEESSAPSAARRRLVFLGQAALAAFVVGVMMQLRWRYSSGEGDHWVLSLLGMHWARPDWFANDWALLNAPQPHWFFDVITWFGVKTDMLGGLMFLYWLTGLAVFGSATAMLARAWTPQHTWLAVVAYPVLAAVAPVWVLGNGSPLYPIGVPGNLGQYLIYLMVAALLTERHRLAAIVGMVVAVIHLQQGLLGVALMLAVALVVFLRTRRVDRWLIISAVVAMAIIYAELRLRPVAGHSGDFAEACVLLIPYHCDATTWALKDLLGSAAIAFGFTSLTVLFLRRDLRLRAFLMLGVPAIVLFLGLAVDLFDVPVLAEISQGLFVNRLVVILFPFGMWGMLAPFLSPRINKRVTIWSFVALAGLTLVAISEYGWGTQFWELFPNQRKVFLLAWLAIPYLGAAAWAFHLVRKRRLPPKPTLLVGLVVAVVLSFGFQVDLESPTRLYHMHVKSFDLNFVPNDGQRAWGREVESLVPSGKQLLIPITSDEIRLVTRRAVVVDCKYGPYGGPAWQEYKERIESLGGFEECRHGTVRSKEFTASHMTELAKRWGADYMVVDQNGYWRVDDLENQEGWTVLLRPQSPDGNYDPFEYLTADQVRFLRYYLLKAPWA